MDNHMAAKRLNFKIIYINIKNLKNPALSTIYKHISNLKKCK